MINHLWHKGQALVCNDRSYFICPSEFRGLFYVSIFDQDSGGNGTPLPLTKPCATVEEALEIGLKVGEIYADAEYFSLTQEQLLSTEEFSKREREVWAFMDEK